MVLYAGYPDVTSPDKIIDVGATEQTCREAARQYFEGIDVVVKPLSDEAAVHLARGNDSLADYNYHGDTIELKGGE